ncbi:ABC transporter permease [Gorillibacterium massiliense]|uniref:ABC transporter permease n=1 Tax=Gorillibacterium massiliense TaxID=1280390 RepID=UPI0004B56378|nr:ABC transporter permease [Gorillibacterium massiliense]
MLRYIARRGLNALITLWVMITLTFALMHMVPGGPFTREKKLPESIIQNLNRHYHLDESIIMQYFRYLGDLFHGDLGPSMTKDRTINSMLSTSLPVSLQLGLQALIVALIGGLILGVIAALYHNKWPDNASSVLAVLGTAVPSFVLATLLIQFFAIKLGWFPIARWVSWKYTVLPTLALSFSPMAQITRMMRSNMLDVLNQDYIKTAKAKGLTRFKTIYRHTVRNAILPVITILGPIAATLLTGTFIIEKIFSIPGAGKLLVESISNRDYPLILGSVVVYGAFLVIILFITDVIYTMVDPRIKLAGKGEK